MKNFKKFIVIPIIQLIICLFISMNLRKEEKHSFYKNEIPFLEKKGEILLNFLFYIDLSIFKINHTSNL